GLGLCKSPGRPGFGRVSCFSRHRGAAFAFIRAGRPFFVTNRGAFMYRPLLVPLDGPTFGEPLPGLDAEDAVGAESYTMGVNSRNPPPAPEGVPPKREDGALGAFGVCANATGPLFRDANRCYGAAAALEFSRNGENLPAAAAGKGRVLSVRGPVIDVVF